jgi:SAM-dependent methyltransferase
MANPRIKSLQSEVYPVEGEQPAANCSAAYRGDPENLSSKFVTACVNRLPVAPSGLALDIPCGFGRHAHWLARHGYEVVAVDLCQKRLSLARKATPNGQFIRWIAADLERELPIRSEQFDLAVIVHYYCDGLIERTRDLLKPGGHLILETFGAQGQNWRVLPKLGSLQAIFSNGFRVIEIIERPVGPDKTNVVAKAFVQRTD